MYNFLRSERYRLTHQPSLYVFLAICVAIVLLPAALFDSFWSSDRIEAYGASLSAILSFGVYIFAAVFVSSFHKDRQMLLQLSTQGHPRHRILLGQYVLSLGVALLFGIILLILAGAGGLLAIDHTAAERTAFLRGLLSDGAATFLLLIPLHALGFTLQYLMRNTAMSVAVFFVLAFFLPAAFSLGMGLNRVLNWFIVMSPYYQTLEMYMMTPEKGSFARLGLSVLMNTAFWMGIGLIGFRKSEI